ncbi:MAG: hypothetical protein OEY84_01190 [Rhodospirillaceae bacterium]|nr:hypothetical protein [Rhodospirillaceae bacterium]
MSDDEHSDDYKKLMSQKRFLSDIEQGIRLANREVIHARIPEITKKTVLSFSLAVASLRARYLEEAFRIGAEHGNPPDQQEIKSLRTSREMYEEAKSAFEALRYAIERGYVDITIKDE